MPGPLKKPDDQRARRNKDVIPLKVLYRTPTTQPELPPCPEPDTDWHVQTVLWWHMWGQSELAAEFTDAEWSYLTDTALLHHAFWNGNEKVAGELRLRSAKFGVTPEDRVRLRIQVLAYEDAEEKAVAKANTPNSRGRYQPPAVG
jgi:hypothetical protein